AGVCTAHAQIKPPPNTPHPPPPPHSPNSTPPLPPPYRFPNSASHCCSASPDCFNTLSSIWPVATSYIEILCSLSAQSSPTHATISSGDTLFLIFSVVISAPLLLISGPPETP